DKMKKIGIWLILAVMLIASTTTVYAVPTTIDFEDLGHLDYVGTHYPGLTFSATAQALKKPDYNYEGYPPHSGDIVIFSLTQNSITITFDSPVTMVGAWITAGVSDITLTAYDEDGNVLDSATVSVNYRSNDYAEVNSPGIKYVTISDSGNLWTMDDLTYDYGGFPAPEFATPAVAVAILLTTPAFSYLIVRKRGV
ncbi:MAG: hypothetical protein DRO89_02105, partial [Candidatus Altiarchaeales archaeon]